MKRVCIYKCLRLLGGLNGLWRKGEEKNGVESLPVRRGCGGRRVGVKKNDGCFYFFLAFRRLIVYASKHVMTGCFFSGF